MRRTRLFKALRALVAYGGFGCGLNAATILSLTPASATVAVGGQTSVELDLSGLGNGASPAVSAYTGLLLSFDPTVLLAQTVTFSGRLGDVSNPSEVVALSNIFLTGAVELDAFSLLGSSDLFSLQSRPAGNPVDLATITFLAISGALRRFPLATAALWTRTGTRLHR